MKTCTKCKTTRSLDFFVRDRTRPDGYYSHCKVCRKAYHLSNREYIVAKQRQYNAAHQQEIKDSHKRYAAKRFFYIRANNLALKAKDCATHVEIARLWKRQRGICGLSGRRLNRDNAQLDHIVPFIKGGSSVITNLRWVHRDVNYAKRDLSDAEFHALCQEVVDQLSRSRERT